MTARPARIVITGALGHIGSRLIHSLPPGEFDEVVLFDNLSTQRYCSLFALPRSVPFRFIEGDVRTADLDALLEGAAIVVHLAALTNAALSLTDEDRMEAVNFEGTERVARACARQGCRMLLPSTTSVYGVMTGTVDEACPITDLQPQNPYAATKLRAERMLEALGATGGLRYFIGRLATVYDTSVGMRFHTAINKFCWQASLGQPLGVWRTAMDQARPYLDLEDAVRAMLFVMRHDLFDARVYNVVTENATVRESGRADPGGGARRAGRARGLPHHEPALLHRVRGAPQEPGLRVSRGPPVGHPADPGAAERPAPIADTT